MKITPTKCLDGKRHCWEPVRQSVQFRTLVKTSWCPKCGSLTEFYRPLNSKRWRRVTTIKGATYIKIPSCHS